MCSTSLAYVPRGPTRQWGRGGGGREGRSIMRRKWGISTLHGDAWGAQLSFLTAWNLFICYNSALLLETAQTSIVLAASKDYQKPEQDGISVHLPPQMRVGRKAVLHLFWYLSTDTTHLLYTPFCVNSALCLWLSRFSQKPVA